MAQAEFHEVLTVEKEPLFKVITQYEDYPEFVDGCKAVKVERKGQGKTRVFYEINIMSQDFTYTLDHIENFDTGKIEWSLVESTVFKKNTGRWEIQPAGKGKSDVTYILDIEFKIPVPGFILNRLVKNSLPGMIKSFEKKATKAA